jgi:phosphoenolpyruvate synthase/pyruvate phosphate dikinase
MSPETAENAVRWFEDLNVEDVSRVGGKNACPGRDDPDA